MRAHDACITGRPVLACVIVLALALACLLAAAPVSVSGQSSSTAISNSSTLLISATNVPAGFLADAVLAYSVTQPQIRINVLRLLAADARIAQLAHTTDASVTTAMLTIPQSTANPDAIFLPLFAYALVPVFNLPDGVGGQLSVRLNRVALAGIFSARITTWNHPEISALNPGQAMPPHAITVIYTRSASSSIWYRALSKFDAGFSSRVTTPTGWNSVAYAASKQVATLVATVAAVLTTPYSISWSAVDTARGASAPMAVLDNIKNTTVSASSISVSYAAAGAGAGTAGRQATSATDDIDLTDGDARGAWSISSYVYLQLSRNFTRVGTDCGTKRQLVHFLMFLYTSDVSSSIAESHGLSLLTSVLFEQMDVRRILLGLQCDGQAAFNSEASFAGTTRTVTMRGAADLELLLSTQIGLFADSSNSQVAYSYQPDQSSAAVAGGAADIVLAPLDQWRATRGSIATPITAQGPSASMIAVPLLLVPASVLMNLPAAVMTRWTAASASTQAARPLFPVSMSLELVGRVFSGGVSSWLDADITALNPNIAFWFNVTSPLLTVVLANVTDSNGAMASAEQMPLTALCLETLSFTASFAAATGFQRSAQPFPSQPLSLLSGVVGAAGGPAWRMIDSEDRMAYLASLIDGAVTLAWPTGAARDTTVEVQLVRTDATGAVVPLLRSQDAMQACLADPSPSSQAAVSDALSSVSSLGSVSLNSALLSPDDVGLLAYRSAAQGGGAIPAQCYPLTQLRAALVASSYDGASADSLAQATDSLRLLQWFNSNDDLARSVEERGGVLLPSTVPAMRARSAVALNSIVNDGTGSPILVHLPNIWSLSPGVQAFCLAIAGLGLAGALLSAVGLAVHRSHPVVRSASLPFLSLVLVGVTCLLLAVVVLVVPAVPSGASCRAWLWLATFGLTLSFSPIVAKVFRVFRIFHQKQIRVLKLSNAKLGAGVLAVLIVDTILLLAWELQPDDKGGLRPLESAVVAPAGTTVYTQCGVVGDGASLAPIVVLGVLKGLILAGGGLLAFRSRHVKAAFNESAGL